MPGLVGCTYNIKKDLAPSFADGGTWKYIGYNVSSNTGPWTGTPANPLVNYSANSIIPLGDDFVIETKNKSLGYYKFTYTYLGSVVELIVRVIDDVVTAGVSKTINLTPSSGNTNLLTELGATAGGVWTDVDNVGAAFVNNVLDPSGLSEGEYEFKYNLTGSYEDKGCETCPPLESTIIVKISQSLTVLIEATDNTCAYTIAAKHPDTNTVNSAKVQIATNAYAPTLTVNKVISNDCEGVVYTAAETFGSFDFVYVGVSSLSSDVIEAGGYLETVQLTDSVTQAVTTVPVAPFGPNIANFSGLGGPLTANDLIYNGVDFNTFASSIAKAIQNNLGVSGFIQGEHYILRVGGSPVGLRIQMAAKHNPTTKWFGVTSFTFKKVTGGVNITTATSNKSITYIGGSLNYATSPCPKSLRLSLQIAANPINIANTTYTNIAVVTPIALTVNAADSKLTEDCDSKAMQAIVQNCIGNITYSWSSGETTQGIEKVTRGTYTVTVTCSNPSGTTSAQYVY